MTSSLEIPNPGANARTSVRVADQRGLLIGACAGNSVAFLLLAITKLTTETASPFPIASFGAAFISGAALIFAFFPRLRLVAAHGIVAALCTQVLGDMAIVGGFGNPIMPVYVCILPTVVFMIGPRGLPIWAVVSLGGAAVVAYMDVLGYIPASPEPIESQRASHLITLLISTCVSAITCWHFFSQAEVSAKTLNTQRQHFEYQANHDHLTGLPNRAQFERRAESMLLDAKAVGRSCNLYFLDINGFKPVNDIYGHSTGDRLLVEFAERINAIAGENDLFARLAGDEFVLLTNVATADPRSAGIGENIKEAISRPFEFDGHNIEVGVSVGVARFPHDGENIARLLLFADHKMYEEKDAQPQNEEQVAVVA